jgi:PPOX class probable F420-dependent enzyme
MTTGHDDSPIPAEFLDLLERPLLAHLATVRTDGTPQVCPMWFAWEHGSLAFSSTRKRRKHVNLASLPQAAVSIADPDSFRHIELRGPITVEADGGCEFWRRLARRYGDSSELLPHDAADRVVYYLPPRRVSTFARRPDWPSLKQV